MPPQGEEWIRLSVGFLRDPKILVLSPGGKVLYLAGLLYCARHSRDGFIPRPALKLFVHDTGLTERHQRRLVPELVDNKLWVDRDDGKGWVIHRFGDWQDRTSKADRKRTRIGHTSDIMSADSDNMSGSQAADRQIVDKPSRARAEEKEKDIAKGLDQRSMPRAREASRRQDQEQLSTDPKPTLALVVDNAEPSDMMPAQFGLFPTRSIGGIPLATLVVKYAADHSITYPPAESRTDVYRAVLDIATQELPRPSTAWDTFAVTVLADYLHDITGEKQSVSGRRMLQRAIAQFGAERVLHGLTIAATSAAGLDDAHADDELAVLKYATAVLRAENKRRAQ